MRRVTNNKPVTLCMVVTSDTTPERMGHLNTAAKEKRKRIAGEEERTVGEEKDVHTWKGGGERGDKLH